MSFKHVYGAHAVAVMVFALGLALVGGCAKLPGHRTSLTASARPTSHGAPRRVSVISANVAPRIPTAGWQPSSNESIWAGALAGGGAGAGIGAGVCTVSFICPPCYAACVATLGIGGAAVGAFGGHIAHRQLATDPANRMLPNPDELSAQFRARMIATLAGQAGIAPEDGGAASLPFARDKSAGSPVADDVSRAAGSDAAAPPDAVLEIALTEIHAEALRKGGFQVDMKARARLRWPATGKPGEVEDFDYSGKRIAEGGGLEAEAARIAADVEHGMDEMARDIRDKLVSKE